MNPITPPEQVIKRLGLQVANLVIENSTLHVMIQEMQEKIRDMETKLAKIEELEKPQSKEVKK